jgi:phenylalanyl-tRNA synthetase beta chain
MIESLFAGLHVSGVTFEPTAHPTYHPGRVAQLAVDGDSVGVMGQLHPLVQEAFGLSPDNPVLATEIDFERLRAHIPASFQVRPVPRFPAVRQDIALVVDENIPADQVQAAILEAGGQLLTDVRLFDVYQGEQIEQGKKSLAYTLTFSAADRTLTDKQVAKVQSKIVKRLEASLGARLRG